MTPSVYIIGGAGTGKSTFMGDLLEIVAGRRLGPLVDLHAKANPKNVVTLRGHETEDGGLYLGCWRPSFPGTDGLDRASSPVGEEWLDQGGADGYSYLIGEGATLATRRFLTALNVNTDLLLVHLYADDFIKDLRFAERGSDQAWSFVMGTATRSANLLADMKKAGVRTLSVDSAENTEWANALYLCERSLL
jgi:hypothetical protein